MFGGTPNIFMFWLFSKNGSISERIVNRALIVHTTLKNSALTKQKYKFSFSACTKTIHWLFFCIICNVMYMYLCSLFASSTCNETSLSVISFEVVDVTFPCECVINEHKTYWSVILSLYLNNASHKKNGFGKIFFGCVFVMLLYVK